MDLVGLFKRRDQRRYVVDLTATISQIGSQREITGKISNISSAGMMVLAEDSYDLGAVLHLSFRLPAMDEDTSLPQVTVQGRVIYCRLHIQGQFFNVGLELVTFAGEGREHYENYIDRLSGSGSD